MRRPPAIAAAVMFLGIFLASTVLLAGPPFFTDDPETVDYRHWEFYAASQYENDEGDLFGTAPHIEVNYGAAHDLQLHLIVPDAYDRPRGSPALFGLGDIELGAKYRLIQESRYIPMVGTFPLVELPTGSQARGLGTGRARLFIPLWLQKSLGPWTSYGGGGYWINPGTGNKNYWFAGWLLQRDVTKWLTIGAEVFHRTPVATDASSETGYNIGVLVNFSKTHHFICSGGTDIRGPASSFFYAAYLITWGPPETGGERKAAE